MSRQIKPEEYQGPTPTCPSCGKDGQLLEYPLDEEPTIHKKYVWICVACDTSVGVHQWGARRFEPLGTMAGRATRAARMSLHRVFTPIWENDVRGGMTVRLAKATLRRRLADALGRPCGTCYIAKLGFDECRAAEKVLEPLRVRAVTFSVKREAVVTQSVTAYVRHSALEETPDDQLEQYLLDNQQLWDPEDQTVIDTTYGTLLGREHVGVAEVEA